MLRYVKNKIQTVSKKCVIFWHDILVKLIAIYVTSGIFAGRAQRDPAKSHELHKIAFRGRHYLVTSRMFELVRN
jgi:hypothetical protein